MQKNSYKCLNISEKSHNHILILIWLPYIISVFVQCSSWKMWIRTIWSMFHCHETISNFGGKGELRNCSERILRSGTGSSKNCGPSGSQKILRQSWVTVRNNHRTYSTRKNKYVFQSYCSVFRPKTIGSI